MAQLTNLIINQDKENSSSISEAFGSDIQKSVVKQHTRKSKSGKLSNVKQYTDKRQKKIEDAYQERKRALKSKDEKKIKTTTDKLNKVNGKEWERRSKKDAKERMKKKRSHEYDKGNHITKINGGHEFVVTKKLSDGRHEIEKLNLNRKDNVYELTGKKRIISKDKSRNDYGMIHTKVVGLRKQTTSKQLSEISNETTKARKLFNAIDDKIKSKEKILDKMNRKLDMYSDMLYTLAADRDYDGSTSTATIPKRLRKRFDAIKKKETRLKKIFRKKISEQKKLRKQKSSLVKKYGF